MRRSARREKVVKAVRQNWSAYETMWILVLFDLPVATKEERRQYTRFRNRLLDLGLSRMQFSVYVRCVPDDERADGLAKQIRTFLPPGGEVRILQVTARQFQKQLVFYGKKRAEPEKEPRQLELF